MTDVLTGAIDLYPEWGTTYEDNCILAHELTHWLQVVNLTASTPRKDERQAYFVTAECFKAYGMARAVKWAKAQMRHPHVIKETYGSFREGPTPLLRH